MNKQKVYLNSCEIFIESIVFHNEPEEEHVYFIWKKGKKFSKSNPYDIESHGATSIRQKLELSLKIYSKNGKLETKNTHFYVMVGHQSHQADRQLSSFTLGVHDWGPTPQKIKLQVKQGGRAVGGVSLQVKRKQVMQLQNFHKYSAEIEESSQGESSIVVMDLEGHKAQVELIQLQKELEDLKYLNDKLKKDRTFLLSRNEIVEKEIAGIKQNVEAEANRMQEYYDKKIEVHTSIYQEQIQELITTFNETSRANTIIMKSIINQNESLAAEITQLRIILEEELEKHNIQYSNKLAEWNDERERLEDGLHEQLAKIDAYDRDLDDANRKLDTTKQELDNLTLNYEIDKKQYRSKSESYEKQLDTQRKLIADLKNELAEKTEQLNNSKQVQKELEQELQLVKQMSETLKVERMKSEAELQDKKQLIQVLKIEKEENIQTIRSLQGEYQKYIEESERKGISYQKQLQEIELQSKQKEVQFDKLINEERQRYFNENLKLTEVTMKLEDFQKIMIVKDQEIKAYLDENAKLNEQFLEEHRKAFQCEQQIRELFEQTEHYKMLNETAESKVNLMAEELNSCYKKNKEDLETLRDHFEDSMKNREKYYEQEIQVLRAKVENGESSYLKFANEFRVEIELYKDQIEKSQQDLLKQIKQNTELTSRNKSLEIEFIQYQQLLAEAKKQMQERQKRYEETLKIQMAAFEQRKGKVNPSSSIEDDLNSGELKNSVNDSLLGSSKKMTLNVPRLTRYDSMSEQEQLELYRQLEGVGSLDHLKYLMSVEETNKQQLLQIQRLEQENEDLQTTNNQYVKEIEGNNRQLEEIKQENEHLMEIIEQLKQEVRFHMDKSLEEAQSRSLQADAKKQEPSRANLSQGSEHHEVSQEKQMHESKSKKSLNKSRTSRVSRIFSLKNTKEQEVQVELITFNEIEKLPQTQPNQVGAPVQPKEKPKEKQQRSEYLPPKENYLQRQNSAVAKKLSFLENENMEKNEELKLKQAKIEKLELRNRELFEEFSQFRQQMGMKMEIQESKLLEYSEMTKKQDEQISKMKNTILQRDQQLQQVQHDFSLRITKAEYENEQLKRQTSKLKKQIEELEQKRKKNTGHNDFHRIMQQDIEEANRKIIQLSRIVNQLRIEKESAEDEIKIFKKKITDVERCLLDTTDKRATAEEEAQILLRKFNKLKRDYDEKQQEVIKYKESLKKMQEDMASYNSLSAQSLIERKRGLEQKLELEQQVNKKNAQIRKLTKELHRHMQKISETDEYTKERKNESGKEIERLEMQLSKQRRTGSQLQEQVENLSKKMESMEQQHRKRAEQQKQQYREKLSALANDIVQVKNELDVNNQERQNLLVEKMSMKEELDDCMEYIGRLEEFKTRLESEKQQLLQSIDRFELQIDEVKKELIHYQEDSINLHTKIVGLEEELNKQQLISARKSEKVQEYEHLCEKYLYELKLNKVTISQLKSSAETDDKLRSTISELQDQLGKASEKYEALRKQYASYKLCNVFSREQVEQLVVEMKENYEEVRKKQLADTIDELDQEYEAKNLKREKEVIELYNQNAKAKMEIQRMADQNAQLLQKCSELEPYCPKYKKLRQDHDELMEEVDYLRQGAQSTETKYQKYEIRIKQLERVIAELKHEMTRSKSELSNQKSKSSRLEQDLAELQTVYKLTKEELKKNAIKGSEMSQYQKTLIQSQEQKILSIELENNRIKEREENLHREYKEQIRKLEGKINQAISTMQAENANLESEGKNKVAEKERQLKEADRRISSLSVDYQNVVNQLNTIKSENDELAIQLSNTRLQLSEDEEIYTSQINSLKNTIKQMQDIYGYNVNALEEELAELNRQLTIEKLSNRQQNGMSSSRLRESEVERRLEERVKNKDIKIEELKNDIFMLEETMLNLRKNQQIEEQMSENGTSLKYRALYNQLATQVELLNKKHEAERSALEQTQKHLRKQLSRSKQTEQGLTLQLDQQTLELQSLKCELTTTREVYEGLQKQLQKRQIKLADNLSQESPQAAELEQKKLIIKQLESANDDYKLENEQLRIRIRDKQNELTVVTQRLRQEKAMVSRMSKNDNKKITQLREEQNQELKEEIDRLIRENKQALQDIDGLKAELVKAREREREVGSQLKKVNRDYADMVQRVSQSQEIVGKYITVNKKSVENYGVTIEELLLGGFLDEKLFDHEQELNQARQELEQLKFNEDRKTLDLEEVKRENLQLNLKLEDYDYMNEQVETLRSLCDKLEEEKKIAVFREEAIRIRLANLMHRDEAQENIRDGLEAILNCNHHLYA